ncbi:patatin-like phospholipase family protein [Xanthomarina sp. F1114]|uniref:patatin-like phospholipase family protein n=1 Tax=Xanthomarina sp. F1114 TaxID=2996019 RepID=UPI00225E181B|nr:patatin-like phospholipase family protein [Xanthomarina sp. F1114]MCX7549128.1 patatin-like phospholipase family protein [Xanthomarina sp. F1114]
MTNQFIAHMATTITRVILVSFTHRTTHFLGVCLVFLLPFHIFSQDNTKSQESTKPKVALVLSGGGAKGIAHIPLLQTLDSLGIVPDLIVGTSMGSIVGGLYAMGYSGDSIASIARQANWNKLLGSETSLKSVGVEEKSEYGRYLLSLDLIKGKPRIKPSLLKDQNLREFLSGLMYPVYNITNFDDLPIPFRAIATDLVKGEVVVMGEGSLEIALRASMSIPSIFQPVAHNETLLVDGGIMDNFPTDIAKELGADIIIGSDVGGGLEPKEKLDNIATILFQTSMLTSNLKDSSNRELCDILVDHIGNLTYSTGDFTAANIIYKQGEIGLNKNIEALSVLAEDLKRYNQREHSLPDVEDTFVFEAIEYHDVSRENLNLLEARMNIKTDESYTISQIIQGINRAMGTQLFSRITYHIAYLDGKHTLHFNGVEKAREQLSGAIHYDTNQGVGLVVNYTGRNILGYSSRSLVSLDIAEEPKYRLQYQQSIGATKSWWWRAETFGERVVQNYYNNGASGEDLKTSFNSFYVQLNKNLNPLNNYIGVDFNYEFVKAKPKLSPDVNNNVYDLRSYKYKNLELSLFFNHNTMNRVFFATTGIYAHARMGTSLWNQVNAEFYNNPANIKSKHLPVFTKLRLEFENRWAISLKTSLITGVSSGILFADSLENDRVSFYDYGQGGKFMLGGNLVSPVRDKFTFSGLDNSELVVTQFVKLNIGSQFNLLNNFYVTPYMNFASVGFGSFEDYTEDVFAPKGSWKNTDETSFLFSAGTTISYNSLLGPVNLDFSYINEEKKVSVFFSVGLRLRIPH